MMLGAQMSAILTSAICPAQTALGKTPTGQNGPAEYAGAQFCLRNMKLRKAKLRKRPITYFLAHINSSSPIGGQNMGLARNKPARYDGKSKTLQERSF